MYGKLALCFIGLSSGGVIAAGIFAFLAIIGVFPRLIGVTHTRCHVILYETLLILGGTAGNLMDLFHLPLAGAGTAFLALWLSLIHIWWGHRIPAYYCEECGEMVVAKSMPEKCPKCGCTHLKQDEDTLDTWFSSALWPFSTLGWPEKTEEMEYFYPTNVLVTGYDIIFFWVIRMVFSGLEQTGECPFDTVLIHGLVRDSQGRKMSKSLGNGIDPLEVIDKYGADALRMTLMTGNAPGNDMRFYWERVEASRNFANKVWNASRFIMMNIEKAPVLEDVYKRQNIH